MIKFIKITFWILLACFILVVVLGMAALFSPGIQKAIVVKVIKNQPGNRVQIEYLHMGLTSGEIRNAYLFDSTQGMSVEKAVFDYSLTALLFDHELYVKRCELKGLMIDASKPGTLVKVNGDIHVTINTGGDSAHSEDDAADEDSAQTGQPAPKPVPQVQGTKSYDGFYKLSAASKFKLRVENVAMEGTILLPAGRKFTFTNTAGGIAPGSTGTINFGFKFTDTQPLAELSHASGTGLLRITQAAAGGFTAFGADLSFEATGAALSAPAKFGLKLESTGTETSENHSVTLTAGENGKKVLTLTSVLDLTSQKQASSFIVDIATSDFAMIPTAGNLPPLAIKGSGTSGGSITQTAANVQGRFTIIETRPDAITEIGNIILDIKQNPDGSASINIPLTINGPSGVSAITTTGTLQCTGNAKHFNLAVTSPAIYVDDLLAIKDRLLPTPAPETEPTTTAVPAPVTSATANTTTPTTPTAAAPAGSAPEQKAPLPDMLPRWHGVTGSLSLDLKQIIANRHAVENLTSQLSVEESAVTLGYFNAILDGNPMTAKGTLSFTAGGDRPYVLDGSAAVSKFDIGAFLKRQNPEKTPYLECIAKADVTVNGDAPTLEVLANEVRGEIHMTTGKGVLRLIASAGKGAENGLALAGIANSLFGNKVTGLGALTDILQSLQEIPFDRVEINAVRETDLNLNLKTLDLVSPSLRITGAGSLAYDASIAPSDQPLTAKLTFALTGDSLLARKFNDARLLTGKRDDKGLYYGPTFEVKGTPSSPKSNLTDVIKDAITRGLTSEPIKLKQ